MIYLLVRIYNIQLVRCGPGEGLNTGVEGVYELRLIVVDLVRVDRISGVEGYGREE
jgi:hypothetical protein